MVVIEKCMTLQRRGGAAPWGPSTLRLFTLVAAGAAAVRAPRGFQPGMLSDRTPGGALGARSVLTAAHRTNTTACLSSRSHIACIPFACHPK